MTLSTVIGTECFDYRLTVDLFIKGRSKAQRKKRQKKTVRNGKPVERQGRKAPDLHSEKVYDGRAASTNRFAP
jgi:hypothetical protein